MVPYHVHHEQTVAYLQGGGGGGGRGQSDNIQK